MLSKNKISEISSLHQKKFRQSSGSFIVEGEKSVDELLTSTWEIIELFATDELYHKYLAKAPQIQLAEPHLFSKISSHFEKYLRSNDFVIRNQITNR
jgi:tRNA G18 (ribose-2'-O)-methylase SpoU